MRRTSRRALELEAAELLECFQWEDKAGDPRVRSELKNVLTYCLLLADRIGMSPQTLIRKKLSIRKAKYPVERPRARSTNALAVCLDPCAFSGHRHGVVSWGSCWYSRTSRPGKRSVEPQSWVKTGWGRPVVGCLCAVQGLKDKYLATAESSEIGGRAPGGASVVAIRSLPG
ncbi:MazG-like family protein [Curtobacterium sp. ODYSSEY 48 V2]|uniref:MazG-like family protein n=1 Tax=Curtobacterium sp. ODYSSEY 48 V2 TaxID=2939561 RepID=UPI0027E5A32F|nr:MazG-like family protein [Curtobacterium sp. ODYSSEY 48 V2]